VVKRSLVKQFNQALQNHLSRCSAPAPPSGGAFWFRVLPLNFSYPNLSHTRLVKTNFAKRQFCKTKSPIGFVVFPLPKKFFDTFCEPYIMPIHPHPIERVIFCYIIVGASTGRSCLRTQTEVVCISLVKPHPSWLCQSTLSEWRGLVSASLTKELIFNKIKIPCLCSKVFYYH
jgi:hypothetical protein